MSKNRPNNKKEKYFCKSELMSRGWTTKLIDELLPPPQRKRNPHYRTAPDMQMWFESTVLEIEKSEKFKEALARVEKVRENKRVKAESKKKEMKESVENLIPENPIDEFPLARSIKRKFILHVGPTNSGKTHDSLEKLKKAKQGAYLGPLRLLALEVFDRFNSAGVPCTMITGEEMIETPSARITSSTIEMMNTSLHYDVVVVDEVQLISDAHRGHNWTKAIIGMFADEIHLCMAPEAQKIATKLIEECGDAYEVIFHKRATPLMFDDSNVDLNSVSQGDALVVFSRRSVLSLAATLESAGIKTSVIYGNLPPASRREQVRRFTSGEAQVVVSTDAIGMGINLPIKRVIFMETWKFDGEQRRRLLPQEIKQIAGRAGRYGMYEKGTVLAIADKKYIERSLTEDLKDIERAHLGFGEEIAVLPYPLPDIIEAWSKLDPPELYCKMDPADMLALYSLLVSQTRVVTSCSRADVYKMITCPVDSKNQAVLSLWLDYCNEFKEWRALHFPTARSTQLPDLEDNYKCLDLYHQFSRRLSLPIDPDRLLETKRTVAQKINDILSQQKTSFQKRCRFCGQPLPYNHPYGLCEDCYSPF